jgi:uncharacterized protein YndB with AHSA1/START domain
METATDMSLQRQISIAASPETVWQYLVDEEKATRWMGLTASFDPRPGGVYKVEVIPGHTAHGEFVELDPPHRLVFTWGWELEPGAPGPHSAPTHPVQPGSSTVEIELIPDGDRTTLRFSHRGLPSAEHAERHAHGWDHYLERLVTAAGGGDPGADPWVSGDMR